jgi:hypothetical protein
VIVTFVRLADLVNKFLDMPSGPGLAEGTVDLDRSLDIELVLNSPKGI